MMKFLLTILLLIQSCNSDHKKSNLKHYSQLSDLPFYNLILEEITESIFLEYEVITELDKDYLISNEIKTAINDVKTLTKNEKNKFVIKKINFRKIDSLPIADRFSKLMKASKQNDINKNILNYTFSQPFYFEANRVAVFNKVAFMSPSGDSVKGGGERLILFKRTKNTWNISQKIILTDF